MGYGSGIAMSCGVGHRHGSDPVLLWLWYKPVATAPLGPLAWELPYAVGAALKKKKRKKKEKNIHIFKELCTITIINFSIFSSLQRETPYPGNQ